MVNPIICDQSYHIHNIHQYQLNPLLDGSYNTFEKRGKTSTRNTTLRHRVWHPILVELRHRSTSRRWGRARIPLMELRMTTIAIGSLMIIVTTIDLSPLILPSTLLMLLFLNLLSMGNQSKITISLINIEVLHSFTTIYEFQSKLFSHSYYLCFKLLNSCTLASLILRGKNLLRIVPLNLF